ncbi:asparaginase [Patescibacteria group bacterium]|nr:asparaginase [Patescibacteria group bacterium]
MKISFIQTGGTIDKDYPKTTKGYAFEITTPAIERILKNVNPTFEIEIFSAFKKDSTEITDIDREYLYKICNELKNDKIVITHGTDTMLETAEKLDAIKNKTIIITGAMRPEKFSDSDASFNIGMAIGAITILNPGVYIAMHGRVLFWKNCDRNLETGQFIKN